MSIEDYLVKGWDLRVGEIDAVTCDLLMEEGLKLRRNWKALSSWKGISCASKHSSVLKSFYFEKLPETASKYLRNDMYYFNDQVVIKEPKDNLVFEAHYDNYFGPNKEGLVHTVNLAIALTDFNDENGAIEIKDYGTMTWNKLYPKKGDILAINGNTYHRSGLNNSKEPRGLYACVYTEAPIDLLNFYNQKVGN
jgi:hypothetical protein